MDGCEPNSFDGPVQTNEEHGKGLGVSGVSGHDPQGSREDIIERSIGHFRKADATFGQRIADGVAARRQPALAGAAQ